MRFSRQHIWELLPFWFAICRNAYFDNNVCVSDNQTNRIIYIELRVRHTNWNLCIWRFGSLCAALLRNHKLSQLWRMTTSVFVASVSSFRFFKEIYKFFFRFSKTIWYFFIFQLYGYSFCMPYVIDSIFIDAICIVEILDDILSCQ